MARIQLSTNIVPPAAVDIWLDEVDGINEDDPAEIRVRCTVRSNGATGRQPYAGAVIVVKNGNLGNPNATPPIPPQVATESVGIQRGPASYRNGIEEKRVIVPDALTNVLNAWASAGNAGGLNRNQRTEAKKQAVLTQLLADGIIDATLTGNVT